MRHTNRRRIRGRYAKGLATPTHLLFAAGSEFSIYALELNAGHAVILFSGRTEGIETRYSDVVRSSRASLLSVLSLLDGSTVSS